MVGAFSPTLRKRVSELKQSLSSCLEEGSLSKAMSLQFRGRLGFCESQIFGRVGNLAMKSLIDHAYRVPFKKTLNERCRQDIHRLLDRLDLELWVANRRNCGFFSLMRRLSLALTNPWQVWVQSCTTVWGDQYLSSAKCSPPLTFPYWNPLIGKHPFLSWKSWHSS